MGSRHERPARHNAKEVHVLVTGFDSFSHYQVNPSTLVARSLSSILDPVAEGGKTILIHVQPTPVKVSYRYVREHVPLLLFTPPDAGDEILQVTAVDTNGSANLGESARLDNEAHESGTRSQANYDIVVFMGVASITHSYLMETKAYGYDYHGPDVDGEVLADDSFWSDIGIPRELHTGFDCDMVLKKWKNLVPDTDLKLSTNAGRYLCEFIFYSGMAEYWRRDNGGFLPITFLHVPAEGEAEDIERGKAVAEGLIRALVDSR